MKFKSLLFVALLPACIFYSTCAIAQLQDSTFSANAGSVDQSYRDDSLDEGADTMLALRHLKDSLDISGWKKDREFLYMHYLDSLLRNQKDVRFDTVRVDEKSGRIKRRPNKPGAPSAITSALNSWPLKIFFWLLAIFFVVFLSYKIFYKNGLFAKKPKLPAEPEENPLQELNELSEYDSLISEAENKNEFNLATRFLFLKTLKYLSDKGMINFAIEKTNKDYLIEMKERNYFKDFSALTRDYEYIWYGKFYIDKEQYQKLKEGFNSFHKNV